MKNSNIVKRTTCKIILKSFDDKILESYIRSLKKLASKVGIRNIIGPNRLPNNIKRWTVLKSPHIDKKSREQFEWIVHKRYFEISNTNASNQEIFLHYLQEQIPIGIGVEIKKYKYFNIPKNNYLFQDSLKRSITRNN